MKVRLRTAILAAMPGLLLAGAAWSGEGADELTVEDRIYGISLIWQEANYNFAFFDLHPELDWDAEYRHALTRAIAAASPHDYLREAQRFVALLGEGHTNLEPGDAFRSRWAGRPALEVDEIERRVIVVDASRDLAERIPVGSEILRIDGRPVAEVLAQDVFPYLSASTEGYRWRQGVRGHPRRAVGLLYGEVGTRPDLTLETPDGERREETVERLAPGAEVDWLETPRADRPVLEYERLDGDVAYFRIDSFASEEVVERFEAHLGDLAHARAAILDVRENGGGNSAHGWAIGRHFSPVPRAVSRWKTRSHIAAYKAWGRHSSDPVKQAHFAMNAWEDPGEPSTIDPPEEGVFEIPVAVLIGPSTYSAAEDFLSYLRSFPDVVFVGGRSAGSTGQPLIFPIPGGAWVGITAKRDAMPDGTEFVGRGVAPDVEVAATVEDFRAGRDPVLERALALLEAASGPSGGKAPSGP